MEKNSNNNILYVDELKNISQVTVELDSNYLKIMIDFNNSSSHENLKLNELCTLLDSYITSINKKSELIIQSSDSTLNNRKVISAESVSVPADSKLFHGMGFIGKNAEQEIDERISNWCSKTKNIKYYEFILR